MVYWLTAYRFIILLVYFLIGFLCQQHLTSEPLCFLPKSFIAALLLPCVLGWWVGWLGGWWSCWLVAGLAGGWLAGHGWWLAVWWLDGLAGGMHPPHFHKNAYF